MRVPAPAATRALPWHSWHTRTWPPRMRAPFSADFAAVRGGQRIGVFVPAVAGVGCNPAKLELGALLKDGIELLDELQVLDFAPLAFPPSRFPALCPLGNG